MIMRKIEVYDMFGAELGTLNDFDVIDLGLNESAEDALRLRSEDVLRLLIGLDNIETWVEDVVQRERRGERAVPEIVWNCVVKSLRRIADELCEEEECVEYNVPETEEERAIDKMVERLEKERDEYAKGSIEWRLKDYEISELDEKKENLRKPALDDMRYLHVYQDEFRKRFLSGNEPKNYEEYYAVCKGLALRYRDYAKMFEEGEL